MGAYTAAFPKGSKVQIADRAFLENFLAIWKYHHKLEPDQLGYAERAATVKETGYYHGGDVLYKLGKIPGIWHEACLRPLPGQSYATENLASASAEILASAPSHLAEISIRAEGGATREMSKDLISRRS